MNNLKLYIGLLLVVLTGLTSVSCDVNQSRDISLHADPQVGFEFFNFTVNQDGTLPLTIQRIARDSTDQISVKLSVVDSSTTVPANAYSLPQTSISIPSKVYSVQANVNITASNVSKPGQLVILLTGNDKFKAAPNFSRATITISPPAK